MIVVLTGAMIPLRAQEAAKRPAAAAATVPAAAADDRDAHIFIAKPDGSDMKPLPDVPGYDMQGSPCWSHDGQLLAFDAWRQGQGERSGDARIIVVNADGSKPRVLCDGAMPSFSPQSRRIAFSRYAANQGVWVMSSDGPDKELVLLDEKGWGAQWSPDGKQIAYATYTPGGPNMATFDLIEGTTTHLWEDGASPYGSFFWNFAWSPDSREIVFKGQRPDSKMEVGIVSARGAKHGLTTRMEGNVYAQFDWGHDGSRILFVQTCKERENRAQIYWLDPKTKDPPQLLAGQDPSRVNNAASLSSDGTKLAICSHKPPKKAPAAK